MPYHRLDVFQKAYRLSLELHEAKRSFPTPEGADVAGQLRRASKSIVANPVEGMARQMSPRDVVRFLRDAMGSCDETRLWLDYARDLKYIEAERHANWTERYQEVGRMLNGLIRKWSA